MLSKVFLGELDASGSSTALTVASLGLLSMLSAISTNPSIGVYLAAATSTLLILSGMALINALRSMSGEDVSN